MVVVFPYGICAICDAGCSRPSRPDRTHTTCGGTECLREVRRYGAAIMNAKRRRRDHSRPLPTEWCCPRCNVTKPLTTEFWYRDGSKKTHASRQFDRWCKECRRKANAEYRARRRAELNKIQSERRRKRRATWTPEQVERDRAMKREATRRYRERHRERVREQRREFMKRVHADPERHAQYLEIRRMEHRLRREKDGANLDDIRRMRTKINGRKDRRRVPSAPLAAAILRVAVSEGFDVEASDDGRITAICERIGIDPRNVWGWRTGERPTVDIGDADKVLVGLELLWWEVFNEDTVRVPLLRIETHKPARRTRKGEIVVYWERGRRDYGDAGPDHEALAEIARVWEGDTEAAAA